MSHSRKRNPINLVTVTSQAYLILGVGFSLPKNRLAHAPEPDPETLDKALFPGSRAEINRQKLGFLEIYIVVVSFGIDAYRFGS